MKLRNASQRARDGARSRTRRPFSAQCGVLVILAVLTVAAACGGGSGSGGTGGSSNATFTPAVTGFTTYALSGGTIDPNDPNPPCTPPTPPAIPMPAAPASMELLVGFTDWRNTTSTTSGAQCTTSNARRFEGVATFDMSAVRTEISKPPRPTVTGTLTYALGSTLKTPGSPNGVVDLCTLSLEMAPTAPTTAGLVPLNFITGSDFPPSAPPSLGVMALPVTAPLGQATTTHSATVDATGGTFTVSVDLSLLLWDWATSTNTSLALVFRPRGVPMAATGIRNATPIPTTRSNDRCTSIIKNIALTVHANHAALVWRDLSAGYRDHACAVKYSGETYCWGSNENGQLGASAPPDCSRLTPTAITFQCSKKPLQVQCGASPCSFTAISAGAEHTCALDASQHAWCWGSNFAGQLGLGGTLAQHPGGQVPAQVVNSPQFTSISAGGFHTCGLTVAGAIYCWGNNDGGEVGTTSATQLRAPSLVPFPGKAQSVVAGWNFTCAVDEGGIESCWGWNTMNVLANTANIVVAPFCANCTAVPVTVQGPHFPAMNGKIVDIAAPGGSISCAHVTTGEVICWGQRVTNSTLPASQSARMLSTGFSGYCAIVGQVANCWGDGNNGELGDGQFHNAVLGPFGPAPTVAPPAGFLRVATGTAFACGVSDLQDLYCWGSNSSGKLGDGTFDARNVPTKVLAP